MIVLSIIAMLKVITINGANVLKTDIKTQDDHGIVHVVDRVLFPPTGLINKSAFTCIPYIYAFQLEMLCRHCKYVSIIIY